jgi:RNA polymerase sigma-70 factor (ECF subfamily)
MSKQMNKEATKSIRNDSDLVKAFQSGDMISFDELVLRYKDRVFSLCYRFTGDFNEAEDCAQDVFLKVYRSLMRFRLESSFYTWLYRITVNTCKSRLKSIKDRGIKKIGNINNPENLCEDYQALEKGDEGKSPITELEKRERVRLVQSAIDSLPAWQKNVIILRDIEGLSYEEITRITGYRLGTLKSKLSRARHSLKLRLGRII